MSENHPLKEYYRSIFGTYDRVNRVFTFGRDRAWRYRAVQACLEGAPARVLDVCTGTGDFALEVAEEAGKRGLHCELTGYDFSPEMLSLASRKMNKRRSGQGREVRFVEGDVSRMPFPDGSFDAVGITFGIRNLVFENSLADRHLQELRRVLRPGGRLVVLESSKPSSPLWRMLNNIYLRFILPYLGGMLSGNLQAYRYLARSSRNYYTIREMASILESAGFMQAEGKPLFMGSVMLVTATR